MADLFALLDQIFLIVSIEGGEPVTVFYFNDITIPFFPSAKDYAPFSGGENTRSGRARYIDTVMERTFSGKGIFLQP